MIIDQSFAFPLNNGAMSGLTFHHSLNQNAIKKAVDAIFDNTNAV
jgi:hypothetical protein